MITDTRSSLFVTEGNGVRRLKVTSKTSEFNYACNFPTPHVNSFLSAHVRALLLLGRFRTDSIRPGLPALTPFISPFFRCGDQGFRVPSV